MNYVEYTVKTTIFAEEIVSAVLNELGAHGVVFEDSDVDINGDGKPDALIKAYFPEDAAIEGPLLQKLSEIRGMELGLELGSLELEKRTVAEEDWAEGWKKYFKPLHIGNGLVVVPGWEEYSPAAGETIVTIDPGMAFGTGQHASTAMCMAAIEEFIRPGMRMLDIGCGSGILAITAAKLRAAFVKAVDIDITAVEVAAENAAINNVSFDILEGDITADPKLRERIGTGYDMVSVNIIADVIVPMAPYLPGFLVKGGIAVLSGIIDTKAGRVYEALRQDFTILSERRQEDWVCICAAKK